MISAQPIVKLQEKHMRVSGHIRTIILIADVMQMIGKHPGRV